MLFEDTEKYHAYAHPVHYGSEAEATMYRVQIIESDTNKVVFERIFNNKTDADKFVARHTEGENNG